METFDAALYVKVNVVLSSRRYLNKTSPDFQSLVCSVCLTEAGLSRAALTWRSMNEGEAPLERHRRFEIPWIEPPPLSPWLGGGWVWNSPCENSLALCACARALGAARGPVGRGVRACHSRAARPTVSVGGVG